MKDQHLFDNWQHALNVKDGIIHNQRNYHYTERVPVKHKTRICGINAEPYYTYHDEPRFNHAKYNSDLANADNNIRNCAASVDNKIKEYRGQLASALKTKGDISSLKSNIDYLRSKTSSMYDSDSQLNAKVDRARYEVNNQYYKLSSLSTQIQVEQNKQQQTQAQITQVGINVENQKQQLISKIKTKEEISSIKQDIASLQKVTRNTNLSASESKAKAEQSITEFSNLNADVSSLQKQNKVAEDKQQQLQTEFNQKHINFEHLKQQFTAEQKQIFDMTNAATSQQRAEMIGAIFDNPKAEEILHMIEMLGFDANYLAHQSIERNHEKLFDFSLEHGADCSDIIDNKTLLQIAIHKQRETLLLKILNSEKVVNIALLNAVNNVDLITIEKLLNHDKSYIHKKFHGYTLLHKAASGSNLVVANKLLSIDNSCINDLTDRGESVFKIGLRSSNEEFINSLLNYITIEDELTELIKSHEYSLFLKAISVCKPSATTNQALLYKALANNEINIAKELKNKGAQLGEAIRQAQQDHNENVLQSILEIDFNAFDSLPEVMANIQTDLAGDI